MFNMYVKGCDILQLKYITTTNLKSIKYRIMISVGKKKKEARKHSIKKKN